jgi:hypothetical protein
MREELLTPVENIIRSSETLLVETEFSDMQRKFVQSINSDAIQFYDMLVSIPNLTWGRAREMLSYEARSHLASIIGYTEMLLEEDGEGLIDVQRDYLQAIHDDGQYMLDQLNEL